VKGAGVAFWASPGTELLAPVVGSLVAFPGSDRFCGSGFGMIFVIPDGACDSGFGTFYRSVWFPFGVPVSLV
jgi:hypothetical protein